MINKDLFDLKLVENSIGKAEVDFLLLEDETIEFSFKSMTDMVIITNKRFIAMGLQDMIGSEKKEEFSSSLPLNKIQAFSIVNGSETLQNFNIHTKDETIKYSALELKFSGLDKVKFEFNKTVDIKSIGTFISKHLLNN